MHFIFALKLWTIMVLIAIANGFFGELVLKKFVGDYVSHLYKTAVAIVVIFLFARYFVMKTAGADPWYMPAMQAGAQWLVSSIVFEFLFGHYVFGFPWEKLWADYRIWEGRLWSLVLLTELIAPFINAYFIARPN